MRRYFAGNRVTLKHIKRVTKPNGRVFIYLAVPGQKLVRLPDVPMDSREFLEAYMKASAAPEPVRKGVRVAEGSIAAAIQAFQQSTTFLTYADGTRRVRRSILSDIADIWGRARITDLRDNHIAADVAKHPGHPGVHRLKAWRGLCAWAKEVRLIADNPALLVERPRTIKTDGHHPWTDADISAFRDHWKIDTPQRLAMEILYWTAARASDAVRLGPGMIDKDGWLVFRQEKTGGEVAIPFNRSLPEFAAGMQGDLDQMKEAISHAPRHMTWITTMFGSAKSKKSFSAWFSSAATSAGLSADRSAHGLRKSRAIALAEAGATVHQIAAWTGHETLSEVQRYAKAAERRKILSGTEREHVLETAHDEFPKTAKKLL